MRVGPVRTTRFRLALLSAGVVEMRGGSKHQMAGDRELAKPVDDGELVDGVVAAGIFGRITAGDQDESGQDEDPVVVEEEESAM